MAMKLYKALRQGDCAFVRKATREFLTSPVTLRNTTTGYVVSLFKASTDSAGYPGVSVRAPLPIPSGEELAKFKKFIEHTQYL